LLLIVAGKSEILDGFFLDGQWRERQSTAGRAR
jgi:hypothetical protein